MYPSNISRVPMILYRRALRSSAPSSSSTFWLLRVPCMPCTTSCWLRADKRFICTAPLTMANSSGAATMVKPINIRPLKDLGRGIRMTGILTARSLQRSDPCLCRITRMSPDTPYSELSPETVLDALEALDFRSDGRVLALNSYENRVYQIGIE